MTQINREELIAECILAAQDASYYKVGEYDNQPISAQLPTDKCKTIVEAVLKAIGEYLPSVAMAHEELYKDSKIIIECGSTAYDLYTQFKNICEGK